jgi:hypothetical protein
MIQELLPETKKLGEGKRCPSGQQMQACPGKSAYLKRDRAAANAGFLSSLLGFGISSSCNLALNQASSQ